MAGGVNKVILVGNLGADPEVREAGEKNVCELRLATNERWTDKAGQKQERVEWHRIIVWGKLGQICAEYLSKGRQIFVWGRIQTRNWEDKDGNKRYTTEIVANDVQFLGGREDGQERQERPERPPAGDSDTRPMSKRPSGGGGYGSQASGNPDDDLPF